MAHRNPNACGLPPICTLIGAATLLSGCGGTDDDPVADVPEAVAQAPGPDTGATDAPAPGGTPPVQVDPDPDPGSQPLPPPGVLWRSAREGTLRGAYKIGGNENMVITLSRELREQAFLTAVSPATGDTLWRLADVGFTNCFPAVTADGHVVAHLDQDTAAGGNDNSHDLALIDGASGAVLDTFEPGNGRLLYCGANALMASDGGVLVHVRRNTQRGLSVTGAAIEPLWDRVVGEGAADPVVGDRDPSFFDEATMIGERYYMMALEPHADGFDAGLTVYQFDAATGATLGRIETDLRVASNLQVAGPGKLLVSGSDKDRGEAMAVLVGGVGAADAAGAMTIDWTRGFDGNGDGVTAPVSDADLATADGAFAGWAAIAGGDTLTEFDLATGQARWSALTSSFSNNDSVASLPVGGYAVFPFGGNFLEGYDANGDPAWEIPTADGVDFAQAMGVYGNTLVLVAPADEGWAFVGVGPLGDRSEP